MSLATERKTAMWMSVSSAVFDNNINWRVPGPLSISVIMESGLGSQYAGIHLVLLLVAMPQDLEWLKHPSLRPTLTMQDNASIRNRSRPSSHLPFCAVVLGVEFRQDKSGILTRIDYSVEHMSEATAHRTGPCERYPSWQTGSPLLLDVLYDSHIPWRTRALDDSHPYSINIRFRRPNYEQYDPNSFTMGKAVTVHISTCNSNRTKYPISLPPEVMLRIGISMTKSSHALEAALVAKSWFHILNGFVRRIGWFDVCRIMRLGSFAEALKSHAEEWGPHITALEVQIQRMFANPVFHIHILCEIIKCAPNLRVLNINPLLLIQAQETISGLKHLEEMECRPYAIDLEDPSQIPANPLISVEEIVQTISTIPSLQRFRLYGVGRSKLGGNAAPSEPPLFQLISFKLQEENISSAQLEYLVSCPNQPPRLKILDLYKVGGFSPEAFSRFLSIVAPTLCSLRIIDCDVAVIRKEDNKSVLDEVIGRMGSLTTVELFGRVLTSTVVSSAPNAQAELITYARQNLITRGGLDLVTTLRQCDVINWSKITIQSTVCPYETIVDRRAEAKALAVAKGFEIVFQRI